jgi:hypothetical protein
MRTIVTAALQRQYWQTELTFWITLVFGPKRDKVTGDWRELRRKKLQDVLHTKYYPGDQTENKLDRACGTYRAEKRCIQGFGGET